MKHLLLLLMLFGIQTTTFAQPKPHNVEVDEIYYEKVNDKFNEEWQYLTTSI